jgi:hypothetical protein
MRNIKIILGAVCFVVVLVILSKLRTADHGEQARVNAAATLDAAAPATLVAPVSPADPKREAVCIKMLNDLNHSMDAFKSYRRDGEDVRVEVRDAYYLADFDAKQAFDANIRCAVSDGRVDGQGILVVSYIDARTHKDVAQWGKYTGFTVAN